MTLIPQTQFEFNIIIDDSLVNISKSHKWSGAYLVGMINGFQDTKWQKERFMNFIFDYVIETALSAKEREMYKGRPGTLLNRAKKNLRVVDDDETGGEIGEIFLYGVLRRHYNALPIVPKIFYKQNTKDYAKGADSVHLVIRDNVDVELWLGEGKFYNELTASRFDKIVNSVIEMISTKKLEKELNIVTSLNELEMVCKDEEIVKKVRGLLSDGISLDEVKQCLHIPILLLHECSLTASSTMMSQQYVREIKAQHVKNAEKCIEKLKMRSGEIAHFASIKFHVIVFPVPSKAEIVRLYNDEVR